MKNFISNNYSQHQKMSKLEFCAKGANVGKKDKRYPKFSNFLIEKFVFSRNSKNHIQCENPLFLIYHLTIEHSIEHLEKLIPQKH